MKGFTLIELLVVIAIIALLVSILLPSLKSAQDLAKRTVCAVNLKHMAEAMVQYASHNDGLLVAWTIDPGALNGAYPDGDWWANMLVRDELLQAPKNLNNTPAVNDNGAFRCPEGIDQFGECWNDANKMPNGLSNRLPEHFMWTYRDRNTNDTVFEPIDGFAVRTWYTLNCYNQSQFPFRWHLSQKNQFHKLNEIVRASEVVMCLDGNGGNVSYQGGGRPAGRHPQISRDGQQGVCNTAFFDGHVDGVETTRYNKNYNGGVNLDSMSYGTIFNLNYDK